MCQMEFWHVCLLVMCLSLDKVMCVEYPEPDNGTSSGCFGDTMDSKCDAGDVILVGTIQGGSKPNGNACPGAPTSPTNPECCNHEPGDCLFPTNYSSSVDDTFRRDCGGLGECAGLQQLPTLNTDSNVCNLTEYKPFSQYVQMTYYCVEEIRIGSMCGSFSEVSTNLPIYIESENYPASIPTGNGECDCSIQTDSDSSTLTIYTIHRELYNGSVCQQTLTLEDGTTNETFTCDDNTGFVASSRQSSTNYVRLIWTNTAPSAGGRFWMGFHAVNTNLTVNCPAVPKLTNTTTTSTTTTSTTTSTTTTSTTTATSTTSSSTITTTPTTYSFTSTSGPMFNVSLSIATATPVTTETSSQTNIIQTSDANYTTAFFIAVSVIGFLLLVIIVVLCIICLRKRNSVRDQDLESNSSNNLQKHNDDKHERENPSEFEQNTHRKQSKEKVVKGVKKRKRVSKKRTTIDSKFDKRREDTSVRGHTTKPNIQQSKAIEPADYIISKGQSKPTKSSVIGKTHQSALQRKGHLPRRVKKKPTKVTKQDETVEESVMTHQNEHSGETRSITNTPKSCLIKAKTQDNLSVNGEKLEIKKIVVKSKNRKRKLRRRRLSIVDQTNKYETLLKIVSGSYFKVSRLSKEPYVLQRSLRSIRKAVPHNTKQTDPEEISLHSNKKLDVLQLTLDSSMKTDDETYTDNPVKRPVIKIPYGTN